MKNYGQYSAAIKSLQMAAGQAAGGYHMSADDLHSVRLALRDFRGLLDSYDDAQAAALRLDGGSGAGGYSPAVLLKDSGGYVALVYRPQAGAFTERGAIERATDALDSRSYLSEDWTAYTNAGASLDWYQGEGFTLAI